MKIPSSLLARARGLAKGAYRFVEALPRSCLCPCPPLVASLLAPPSLAYARCPGEKCEAPLLHASLRFGRGALAPAPPSLALGLPKSLAAPRPALRYAVGQEGLASLLLRHIALPISCCSGKNFCTVKKMFISLP